MKPTITRRQLLLATAAGAATSIAPSLVHANTWSKPITIINPFAAGGGTDAFARPLSAALTKQLGVQVIIDNRGGAGGTLGAGIAAKAAPDGQTFFMGAVHHTIAPSMYKKLDYDLERDFVPICMVAAVPQVLVVNPTKVPVNDAVGFIDFARKNPGKLSFGSAGNGTSHHLAGELFKGLTKTFITHIPYRGAGPALQDLVGGQIDLMFDGLGSSSAHIRGGRIRALALASAQRAEGMNIPTNVEAGLKGWDVSTWYGMWAIKGTPANLQQTMHAEIVKALNSKELKDIWLTQGARAGGESPTQFAATIRSEIVKWADVVKRSGAKLD